VTRLFLTAVVCGGAVVGAASADYLMLKVDLNKALTPASQTPRPGAIGPPGVGARQPNPNVPGPRGMQGTGQESQEPPLWATAYLELKRKPAPAGTMLGIEHPWGKALVPPNLDQVATIRLYPQASVARRFDERKKTLAKEGKTPEKLLQLAAWALEHGLTRSFLLTMDEVAAEAPDNAIVKAVAKVRQDMRRPVTGDDPAAAALLEDLKRENYRSVPSEQGHYVLYTDLRSGEQNDVEVKRFADRLEATYHNFFYWFAIRGKVLPVPTRRLVAVLVARPADFEAKRQSLNPDSLTSDGFMVRQDNVAVLSAQRNDDAYNKLEKNNREEWQQFKVGRDDLLSGNVVKRRDLQTQPALIAKLQTLAVLQKAMEEESERASVTHEATRQLFAAAGILPRSVLAAEWVHFGMASFFETPYEAYYPGTGLPSWIYLVEFKHLKKTGELGKSHEVLLRTVTDRYFVAAGTTQQQMEALKDHREELEPLLQEQLRTARGTAWALTYYLARYKRDGLHQYMQELASLPRDLEFDEAVLQGCFARAFGLSDSADPKKIDMAKLTRLADAWYTAMDGETLDIVDVQTEALRERAKILPYRKGQRARAAAEGPNNGVAK
jgi:hypothetical protein